MSLERHSLSARTRGLPEEGNDWWYSVTDGVARDVAHGVGRGVKLMDRRHISSTRFVF